MPDDSTTDSTTSNATFDPAKFKPHKGTGGDAAFDPSKLKTAGSGKPLGGEGAELSAGPGPWARGAEDVGKMVAQGGGMMAGAAGGTAVGGPVGGVVGGSVGMGLAGTGADAAIAELNKKIYGTPTDLSPAALKENVISNQIGAAAGTVLGGVGQRLIQGPITSGVSEVMAAQGEKNALEQAAVKEETELGPRGIAAATDVSPEETEAALHGKGEIAPRVDEEGQPILDKPGIELPPPQLVTRRNDIRDFSFGPSHEVQKTIGAQFNERLANHMDTDVPIGGPDAGGNATGLRGTANEVRDWAKKEGYTLSPPVEKLLGKIDKVGIQQSDTLDLLQKWLGKNRAEGTDVARMPLDTQGQWLKAASNQIKRGNLNGLSPEEAQRFLAGTAEKTQGVVAKPRELLGLRREASALTSSESSAINRSAANDVVDSIDDHLSKSGLPGMDDLRAKYATHKAFFGQDFYRNIAKTGKGDPIDAAPGIFNNKDIAAPLYRNNSPKGQADMRRLYGDWVFESGSKGKSVIDWGTQRDFLKEAFPNTKLAVPTPWQKMPEATEYAEKYLEQDPAATAQIQAIGKQDILGQVQRAQAELAKTQKTPQEAAQIALQERAIGKETHGYTAKMMESVQRRLPLYGAVTAAGEVGSGHVSPFMAGATALGILNLGRQGIQRAFSWALSQSPKMGEAFVKAVQNPDSMVSRQVIGKTMAGSTISDWMEQDRGYGTLEKKPPPADINSVATSAAIKSKEGGVRAVEPGESHDDAIRRTGAKGAVHGFNDKEGNFIDRKEAQAQVKGLGGKDEAPHSNDIALGPRPETQEPVSLGSSPVRKLVSGWMDADPKGMALRDLDDAAREYRRGNVPALDPQKWLAKGLSPSEIAQGYKRSGMSRMDAALSQLQVPQLTEAWKLAEKTHDSADGNRIKNAIAKQLKDGAWEGLKPEEKKRVAEAMRSIYAPEKSRSEA